jgi:hypothetical protein
MVVVMETRQQVDRHVLRNVSSGLGHRSEQPGRPAAGSRTRIKRQDSIGFVLHSSWPSLMYSSKQSFPSSAIEHIICCSPERIRNRPPA